MGTVSTTLPSDGQTIDASDVNTPINAILSEFNGNIDDNNIKTGANINGAKLLAGSLPGTSFDTTLASGWLDLADTPDTVTNNGNRSYDLVFNSTDLTDTVSEGMRLRTTRTVSAPTYMGGAFNGSSHYFTKVTPTSTLSTVTNNFTIMGWVEPTSYAIGMILGRMDAAANNGLFLRMTASGQIELCVINGGGANTRNVTTYQSLSLNKKTHVAASWTGGTVVIYLDGVVVPAATTTAGTAPTTAGTGGDFSIGRAGAFAGQYFAGYISGVGVFDAVLTAATIRSYSSQVLSGSETNCIGAWSLNNTGVNQQAAGTNDLTATGGVSYTVRSPYGNYLGGTLDYAIITKTAFSTNTTLTVQVPEGCTIPTSGGVSAVSYSTQAYPYGFPSRPISLFTCLLQTAFSSTATPTVTDISGLSIPYTATGTETLRFRLEPLYITGTAAATTSLSIYIRDGSTTIGQKLQTLFVTPANMNSTLILDHKPTAGAHTFVGSISQSGAGTMSFVGAANTPAIFSLEVL